MSRQRAASRASRFRALKSVFSIAVFAATGLYAGGTVAAEDDPNNAPVLLAEKTPVLAAVNENASAPSGAVGTPVNSLVDLDPPMGGLDNVTDVDPDPLTGLAIVDADTSNGTWFFTLDNGANWTNLGNPSPVEARALPADTSSRLYFQPAPGFDGAASIIFHAWDQTSGEPGGIVSTFPNDGMTAFSLATDTATVEVIEDTIPIVTIPGPPINPAATNDSTPVLFFEVSSTGAVSNHCRFDVADFVPCSGESSHTPSSDLSDALHTFRVRSTNASGDAEATYSFLVDTIPPTVTIPGPPTNPGTTSNNAPTLIFEVLPDGSSVANTCRITSSPLGPIDTGFQECSAAGAHTSPLALPDGIYNFTVMSTDAAGNVGDATHTFEVDTTVPVVTIAGPPTNPTATNDPTPVLFFEVSSTGAVSNHCRFDVADFVPCSGESSHTPSSDLSEGPHTFHVLSTDAAGNMGDDTHTFTLDTMAPVVTITSAPPSVTNDTEPEFEFSSDEPATVFECALTEGATPPTSGFTSCPAVFQAGPLVSDGPHVLAVRGRDEAGNQSDQVNHAFTLDTMVPVVTITSAPPSVTNDTEPEFEFSSDEPATVFECALTEGATPPTSGFTSCPAVFQAGPLVSDGPHVLAVRGRDEAGNQSDQVNHAFTLDTMVPVVTITSAPPSVTNDTEPEFEFSSDEPATVFECALTEGATPPTSGFTSCPAVFQAGPLVSDGPHVLAVRGRDEAGNQSDQVNHAFTLDTMVPVVTITSAPPSVTNDTEPEFEFSSDEPATVFECALTEGATPPTSGFVTCSSPFAAPSVLDDGPYSFAVRTSDLAGNVGEATHQFTVETTSGPGDDDDGGDDGGDTSAIISLRNSQGATTTTFRPNEPGQLSATGAASGASYQVLFGQSPDVVIGSGSAGTTGLLAIPFRIPADARAGPGRITLRSTAGLVEDQVVLVSIVADAASTPTRLTNSAPTAGPSLPSTGSDALGHVRVALIVLAFGVVLVLLAAAHRRRSLRLVPFTSDQTGVGPEPHCDPYEPWHWGC